MSRFLVAVEESPRQIIFACDGGDTWSSVIGTTPRLDAATRDRAVQAAVDAGMPYEVIEYIDEPQRIVARHWGGADLGFADASAS